MENIFRLMIAISFISFSQIAQSEIRNVDCDVGDSIQQNVDFAKSGDIIVLSGTCYLGDSVYISKSNITLYGGDTTIARLTSFPDFIPIRNGMIQVNNGASGVRIVNLNIDDADSVAVVAKQNANIELRNITIPSSGSGIIIESGSYADLENITVTNSRGIGVEVKLGAILKAENLTATNNIGGGLVVSTGSVSRLTDSTLTGNGNADVNVTFGSVIEFVGDNTIDVAKCDKSSIPTIKRICK